MTRFSLGNVPQDIIGHDFSIRTIGGTIAAVIGSTVMSRGICMFTDICIVIAGGNPICIVIAGFGCSDIRRVTVNRGLFLGKGRRTRIVRQAGCIGCGLFLCAASGFLLTSKIQILQVPHGLTVRAV